MRKKRLQFAPIKSHKTLKSTNYTLLKTNLNLFWLVENEKNDDLKSQ